MIYLSDHGESLGEKGLFLHGVPYDCPGRADPRADDDVFSPGFASSRGLDLQCVQALDGIYRP